MQLQTEWVFERDQAAPQWLWRTEDCTATFMCRVRVELDEGGIYTVRSFWGEVGPMIAIDNCGPGTPIVNGGGNGVLLRTE